MEVSTLAEAQGVEMLCPGCFAKNGGPRGTHIIIAWFRGRAVPDDVRPGPGRWAISGSTRDDLTLNPSVDVGCWHGFIRDGKATGA